METSDNSSLDPASPRLLPYLLRPGARRVGLQSVELGQFF